MANETQTALDAIMAALDVHRAARDKLESAIALIRVRGDDPSDANRLRARATQRVGFYNRLRHEIKAGQVVVGAPTVDQIQQVASLVSEVEAIATADVALKTGLKILADAMSSAADMARGVAVA